MAWSRKLLTARRALDKRLATLQPAIQHQAPAKGWIRAIRNSLGLSAAQLGQLLQVRSQSIDGLERNEAAGTISLDALRRVGRAMDCTLVYALVPNTSLEAMAEQRAAAIAKAALAEVSHTMALEDQQVEGAMQEQIAEYIRDHISERNLWRQR